ncbi:hypothetical protein BT69DRAFT_1302107 [Atractiella rhizophila]|nr:hypothetical protein BT69DRAFT_1302107 [Atractiella rhizophila]
MYSDEAESTKEWKLVKPALSTYRRHVQILRGNILSSPASGNPHPHHPDCKMHNRTSARRWERSRGTSAMDVLFGLIGGRRRSSLGAMRICRRIGEVLSNHVFRIPARTHMYTLGTEDEGMEDEKICWNGSISSLAAIGMAGCEQNKKRRIS